MKTILTNTPSITALVNYWRGLPIAMYFVLLVISAVLSGSLFWDIYKIIKPEEIIINQISSLENTEASKVVNWGPWLDINESQPIVKKAVVENKVVDKISIKVNVLGIFGSLKHGAAIVNVDGGNPQVFIVDDIIKDGVSLYEVNQNYIVIKKGEATEDVHLPEIGSIIANIKGEDDSFLPKSIINNVENYSPEVEHKNKVNNQQEKVYTQPAVQQKKLSPKVQKKISQVRDEIKKSPLSTTKMGRFSLKRVNNKLGIQVKSFKQRDVLIGLGLRLNDVILSVNGISIEKLTKNPRMAQDLIKQNNFKVNIVRNGKNIMVPIKW